MTYKINQEIYRSVSAVQMFPIGFQGATTFSKYEWIIKKPELHMLSIFNLRHLGQIPDSQETLFQERRAELRQTR